MPHLNEKMEFVSDKYPPCGGCECGHPHSPPGYLVLSFGDLRDRMAIHEYARRIQTADPELSDDLKTAIISALSSPE